MISDKLFEMLRCPKSGGLLERHDGCLQCLDCGAQFNFKTDDAYIDMRPPGMAHRDSVYGDEAFLKKKGLLTPGPPFLSGGIKNWVLKKMLNFREGSRVLDGGCGPGRYILWNKQSGAHFVGIDREPYFAEETTRIADLVQGYLHYMPFAESSFDSIICLDVLEHMALEDIESFLRVSEKILRKNGKLLIYTNSVESSVLAPVIRFRQKITGWLVKIGVIDLKIEKESKEDHVNAIKTRDQLIQLAEERGLMLKDSTFYNPVIMGWFENLFIKIAEGRLNKKMKDGKLKKSKIGTQINKIQDIDAKTMMKEKTKKKGSAYIAFWIITQIMKLDIVLFSNIKSGQFFLLFEKPNS